MNEQLNNAIINLPHSLEAEQIILGYIIANPIVFKLIASKIAQKDFFIKEHKEIFTIILNLLANKIEFINYNKSLLSLN